MTSGAKILHSPSSLSRRVAFDEGGGFNVFNLIPRVRVQQYETSPPGIGVRLAGDFCIVPCIGGASLPLFEECPHCDRFHFSELDLWRSSFFFFFSFPFGFLFLFFFLFCVHVPFCSNGSMFRSFIPLEWVSREIEDNGYSYRIGCLNERILIIYYKKISLIKKSKYIPFYLSISSSSKYFYKFHIEEKTNVRGTNSISRKIITTNRIPPFPKYYKPLWIITKHNGKP